MKKLIEKINKIAKDYEELEYFYEPLIGEYEEHLDYFKIVEDKPGICLQDEDLFYKMFLTFISCKRDIYLGDQYDWLFDCQKPVSTLYDLILPLFLLPYVQLNGESTKILLLPKLLSFCFSPKASSYPSSNSGGISFKNLETGLQLVEPNTVLCLLNVKNKYCLALVIPT